MRKQLKPQPLIYPMPVLIIATYGDDGIDAMNAAWGTAEESDIVALYLDASHKTVENIKKTGAFTVSPATAAAITAADYVGVVSGNKVKDKFKKTGWHAVKSEKVNAPIIEELPVALECELIDVNGETGCVRGRIAGVSADERVLGANGRIDPSRLDAVAFNPVDNTYVKLGEKAAEAFSEGFKLR